MIVVGSAALKHFELNRSEPKDLDVWYCDDTVKVAGEDSVSIPKHIYDLLETKEGFATPNTVYTIKCSHLAWDIKWEKTKNDVIWLKAKGCKLMPNLYRALKTHWENVHGDKSFLSLGQDKVNFFNDHVTYVYDHDYLHELVAHPNEPAYKKVLKNKSEVLTDRSKFDKLNFESQVTLFREEITVIAAERWLVNPYWQGHVDWYQTYMFSLKKTITSLTKGWACDFIVCNLEQFVKPNYSYFEYLLKTLELKMSDVNTKPIESFLKRLSEDNELTDRTLVLLADGDLDDIEYAVGVPYPSWNGENRDAEMEAYQNAKSEVLEGYEHVMQEGGGEGGSEYCEGVFRLNDKYYHVSWSYYSHHGYDTDEALSTLKVVTPKEKTVVVYE